MTCKIHEQNHKESVGSSDTPDSCGDFLFASEKAFRMLQVCINENASHDVVLNAFSTRHDIVWATPWFVFRHVRCKQLTADSARHFPITLPQNLKPLLNKTCLVLVGSFN